MAKQQFYIRNEANEALGVQLASFQARAIALFVAKHPNLKGVATKAWTFGELCDFNAKQTG